MGAVRIYHVLMLLMPFGVWVWWQHKHNGDMQNASILFTIPLTLLLLFWSGAGALEQFIANYYSLDQNPLRIGKDSQTFNVAASERPFFNSQLQAKIPGHLPQSCHRNYSSENKQPRCRSVSRSRFITF